MFVTFEGIEGCGKSTQCRLLGQWLERQGVDVLISREPGGSHLGSRIRDLLLSRSFDAISPECELFLYLADRAQHVDTVIRPALDRGQAVLVDRFADSTLVYQGYGRGLSLENLNFLNRLAVKEVWPELTVIIDLPVRVGLERARSRNHELGVTHSEGRFEAEALEFHHAVRQGYLDVAAAHPERCRVVDGDRSEEDIRAGIQDLVIDRFSQEWRRLA
jgi:dTMP kinase